MGIPALSRQTFIAAAARAAGRHHLAAAVAGELLRNAALAERVGKRPYFTHVNLASRRRNAAGEPVQHRNTSRAIVADLAAAGLIVTARYRKIDRLGHTPFSICWHNVFAFSRKHDVFRMARPGSLAGDHAAEIERARAADAEWAQVKAAEADQAAGDRAATAAEERRAQLSEIAQDATQRPAQRPLTPADPSPILTDPAARAARLAELRRQLGVQR